MGPIPLSFFVNMAFKNLKREEDPLGEQGEDGGWWSGERTRVPFGVS